MPLQRKLLKKTLTEIGGDALDAVTYWSSTEYSHSSYNGRMAMFVFSSNGSSTFDNKEHDYRSIRAYLAF